MKKVTMVLVVLFLAMSVASATVITFGSDLLGEGNNLTFSNVVITPHSVWAVPPLGVSWVSYANTGMGPGSFSPPNTVIPGPPTAMFFETLVAPFGTSQVIYALEGEKHTLNLNDNAGNPPKYGYERTTPETDTFSKVLNHSVTIDGLMSGTKYYFRAVSHGSLAVSTEHSFTTLTPEEAIAKAAEAAAGETISGTAGGEAAAGGGEQPVSETGALSQTAAIGENIPEQNPTVSNQSFLAAVGNVLALGTDSVWVGLAVIIILAIVVYVIYVLIQKKRKNLGDM